MHSCLCQQQVTVSLPNRTVFEKNTTEWRITGLPIGTKITVSVAALTNGSLMGEEETIVTYTGNSVFGS